MNFMDPLPALLEFAREQGWRCRRRDDYQGERMFDYCPEHRYLADKNDDIQGYNHLAICHNGRSQRGIVKTCGSACHALLPARRVGDQPGRRYSRLLRLGNWDSITV
jgi:hypothetical protein